MLTLILVGVLAFAVGVAAGPYIHKFCNCRKGCCRLDIDVLDPLIDVGDFWDAPDPKKTSKRKGKRKK